LIVAVNSGIPNFESPGTAQAYLGVLLRDLDDAIICTTAEGVAQIWNPGAKRLFGYAFDEVIGRPLHFFENPRPQKFLPSVQAVGPVEKYRTIAIRKDGTPIEISLAACPIRDGAGDITDVVYTARRTMWITLTLIALVTIDQS
jgi:PAS domain S-box-containing protein